MKCLITSRNNSDVIHPDGLAIPNDPCGVEAVITFLKCLRGKTIAGGMLFPSALMKQQVVINMPRSPLVILQTCFVPNKNYISYKYYHLNFDLLLLSFDATILVCFWTVFVAFSSKFPIRDGSFNTGILLLISSSLSKNDLTLKRINAVDRARLQASGVQILKFGCRLRKPFSHSTPADSFSFQSQPVIHL